MSYNIDTFKIKKMENLEIPLSAFYEHGRNDWHPKREWGEDGKVTLKCGCGQTIKGDIENGMFKVESMRMCGEGSGTFVGWILEPSLKKSKGILEASCVWEGGDLINKLIVNDGNLTWEDIEI